MASPNGFVLVQCLKEQILINLSNVSYVRQTDITDCVNKVSEEYKNVKEFVINFTGKNFICIATEVDIMQLFING